MNIDQGLLDIIVCPDCHGELKVEAEELRLHVVRPGLPRP